VEANKKGQKSQRTELRSLPKNSSWKTSVSAPKRACRKAAPKKAIFRNPTCLGIAHFMILFLYSVKYRKERDLESLLKQTSAHPDCQIGTELIGTVCPRFKFVKETGG